MWNSGDPGQVRETPLASVNYSLREVTDSPAMTTTVCFLLSEKLKIRTKVIIFMCTCNSLVSNYSLSFWSMFMQQFNKKLEPRKVNPKDIWDVGKWKKIWKGNCSDRHKKDFRISCSRSSVLLSLAVHAPIHQSQRSPDYVSPISPWNP